MAQVHIEINGNQLFSQISQILTTAVQKIKWSTNRSSTFQVSPERIVLDLVSQAMGDLGSTPTRGNILSLGFSLFLCLCEAVIESYSCMGDSVSHSNHYTRMFSVLV